HHPDRRHARFDAGQLSGGFAQRHRRAGGDTHRDGDFGVSGFDLYADHPGRLAGGSGSVGRGSRPAMARLAAPRTEKEKERTQRVAPLPSDVDGRPPWETAEHRQPAEYAILEEPSPQPGAYATIEEIPICQVEDLAPVPDLFPALLPAKEPRTLAPQFDPVFRLPPTDLLNQPPERNPYDEQELKDTASRIKAKFEEFHVLGNVVQ